jgi:uncharacterized membrane protein YeiH
VVEFSPPFWTDLVAVAIGSLEGAMFAASFVDRRLDFVGVGMIGIATGMGGGLVRDILLGVPVAAFSTDWYIPASALSALLGMALQRVFRRLDPIIVVLDALIVGLFAAIGVTKALSHGLPAIPAVFVGVISAVGGSVLRDLLLSSPVAVMRVGSLYAVASAAGSSIIIVATYLAAPPIIAVTVGIVITAAIRLLSVRFGWSLPEQRSLLEHRRDHLADSTLDEAP